MLMLFALPSTGAANETVLTGAEIRVVLTGHIVRHADVTKTVLQTFRDGGITYYYEGSEQTEGRWDVRGDKYCAQWPPRTAWTCYSVRGTGTHITFVSANGARFPISVLD